MLEELKEFFPHEIKVERWLSDDNEGTPQYDEAKSFTVRARIVGRSKLVTGTDGREHVSSVQATLMGNYNVSANDRFTLPVEFSANPNDANDLVARQPKALAVDRSSDEKGVHHETIQFSNARIRSF